MTNPGLDDTCTQCGNLYRDVWCAGETTRKGQVMSEVRKFRKKPGEIEAMRFAAYTLALPGGDLYEWAASYGVSIGVAQRDPGPAFALIPTLEGVIRADIHDWVIRGIQGEFYPVKPDIFEATYEAVSDE